MYLKHERQSYFKTNFALQDWRRTGAEYSSAVFIIAPKYPEDPTTADRYLAMCALSLGQYLQEAHVKMEERLSHTPNRVMHWFKHGTVSLNADQAEYDVDVVERTVQVV